MQSKFSKYNHADCLMANRSTCMQALMLSECILLCKTFITGFAHIRFLSAMLPLMCAPCLSMQESLVAVRAGKWPFSCMPSHVEFKLLKKFFFFVKIIQFKNEQYTYF